MSLLLFVYSLFYFHSFESKTIAPPKVVFNQNSLEYNSKYEFDVNIIDSTLIIYPNINLIIRGSMDKEFETIEHLDLKRAKIIRNELINRGVDSTRLFVELRSMI